MKIQSMTSKFSIKLEKRNDFFMPFMVNKNHIIIDDNEEEKQINEESEQKNEKLKKGNDKNNEKDIIKIANKKNEKQIVQKNKNQQKHKQYNYKKKVEYDPIILRMIQSRNKKKFNSNMIYMISDFLEFKENLQIRLVCKLFDDGIKLKYEFLKENIMFSNDKKILTKIRIEYNIINPKNNSKLFSDNSKDNTENEIFFENNDILFDNQNNSANFSKRQILINMLNNKDFYSIKYRSKNGEILVPKNLCVK